MDTRSIIGVGGQFETGKDTLSDYLAATLNSMATFAPESKDIGVWRRNAFATGVKKVFCDTFGVDLAFIEHWKRVKEPPPGFAMPVRQILIDIGDGFRRFRPDVWINRALAVPGNQVISDARYINELQALKNRGGYTILMWRPGYENDNPNASEQELMGYVRKFRDAGVRGVTHDPLIDIFFVNDGNIDRLRKDADDVVVPFIAEKMLASGKMVCMAA